MPDEIVTDSQLFIDGRTVTSARRLDVVNPARPDEVVGTVALGTAAEASRAVEAATTAFPGWSQRTPAERAEILTTSAAALGDDGDARARLLTREQGKILREASNEIAFTAAMLTREIDRLDHLVDHRRIEEPGRGVLEIRRRPRGPALVITPWNWPVLQAAPKLASLLLAGSTVVLKPALEAPLAAVETYRRLAAALPPGVLNIVTGEVSEIGEALTGDARIRHISFTGGTPSGAAVMASAAKNITNVVLELGGNDPAILLDDVELDARAVRGLLQAVFTTTGQGCQLVKRLYVHQSRRDELVDKLVEGIDAFYRVGDGLEDGTTLGPLCTRKQRDFVAGLVEDARSRGAKVLECGTAADESLVASGWFHMPTLVLDVDDDAEIVRREQFGPALPILTFDDEDDALARANDTEYGLAASVWSADPARAWQLAGRLEAGTVMVGHHNAFVIGTDGPQSGYKQSGIGRAHGVDGFDDATNTTVITDRTR